MCLRLNVSGQAKTGCLEVVRLVVADELDPLGGLGAQVAVDDVDDLSGVGATMDQITDLDDDQILGQRAVGARAEAGELVAQWCGVSTDVTDDGDPHCGQVAFRRAGRGSDVGRRAGRSIRRAMVLISRTAWPIMLRSIGDSSSRLIKSLDGCPWRSRFRL